MAPVSNDPWRTLYNLAEYQGEHVRLSWGSSPPPLELTPHGVPVLRMSHPPLGLCSLSNWFRAPDHINVFELTALTSLVKHLAHRGCENKESYAVWTVASSAGLPQEDALRQGVSTLDSGGLHSSVSARLNQSIYCGCLLGEILSTRRLEAPLSTAGNAFSRCGQAKLLLISSGQQPLPVS